MCVCVCVCVCVSGSVGVLGRSVNRTLTQIVVYKEYIDKILKIFDVTKHDGYYVKMAVAWAISVCYIKFPKVTEQYLDNSNLDEFTYKKSIQKIRESYRVTPEQKRRLKEKIINCNN